MPSHCNGLLTLLYSSSLAPAWSVCHQMELLSGGKCSFSFIYCFPGKGVKLCLVHLLRKLVLTLCLAYETKYCYVRRAQGFLQDYCLNWEARNHSLRGGTAKGLSPSVCVHVTSPACT